MVMIYPKAEDWYNIRFSDECHFGYGSEGKYRIIRKPGERYCQKCIQEANPKGEPKDKDQKRVHCWAAVGWNFKSSLFWYEVPTNDNGKLSHKAYLEQILEPAIKPWLDQARSGQIDPFVLEEDNDSSHKGGIVNTWKHQNGLNHYFNCPNSPDLAPIENCWQPMKQLLRRIPHWDDRTTKSIAQEGWNGISQDFINTKIASIPDRLRAVIEGGGAITGYQLE